MLTTRIYNLIREHGVDPSRILRAQGMPPDPWQRELLFGNDPAVLLNCSRQAGKSTTVAALAVHQLIAEPQSLVLLVAPSERQSKELYRKTLAGYRAVETPIRIVRCHSTRVINSAKGRIMSSIAKR